MTAQRGVSWQDSGLFQYRVLTCDFIGDYGIALAHPLYILGAKIVATLFPMSMQFYAIAVFSGVGMAVALALLARILWRLTQNGWAVATAVITLGLSQMCWWMSTITEVYTWSLAFLMAELLCVLNICTAPKYKTLLWWLFLAGINGIHASLHNFALLALPVYGLLFLLTNNTAKVALACALTWLVGAALLVWLFCLELQTQTFGAAAKSLLFGNGYERVVLSIGHISGKLVLVNIALAFVSLASPCWFFAIRHLTLEQKHNAFKRCLFALTCIHFIFWIRYFVPDQATFVLPTLGFAAVWLGIGCATTQLSTKVRAVLLVVGVVCQLTTPLALCAIATHAGIKPARELPFRLDISYWLLPWKQNETSAQQFVDEVGKMLHDNDVLITDSTSAHPLMAMQAIRKTPTTWRLISPYSGETEEDLLALARQHDGHIFVVSPIRGYTPDVLLQMKPFDKDGILYRMLEAQ